MKRIPLFLSLLLLAPLVFAQTCPTQPFVDWSKWAVTLDPVQIATDPNTGQKCVLGPPIYTHPGQTWTIRASICDPDSDPMTLTASMGTLVVHADNTYTLTGAALTLGIQYVTMTLVDQYQIPSESITRKGTWVIVSIPKNKPPVLCGGLP
ncbi:MAG: hypothetical protein ABFE07_10230 [Armatimonadia bacterium]|nr:hypothetical protein [Planctomycetaceae bacterium]